MNLPPPNHYWNRSRKDHTNICIECRNCYADRCNYILTGRPTKNQTWAKSENGFVILSCKRFKLDYVVRINIANLAKLLGIKERTFYRIKSQGKLKSLIKSKKLRVIVEREEDEDKDCYWIDRRTIDGENL